MRALSGLLLSILALSLSNAADAQVATRRIVGGLTNPLWAGAPEGDPRIFVAQQNGLVRVVKNGALLPANFLDISARITTGGERGLLGLAFHPNYAANGFFFVNYTDLAGNTVVSRFRVSATNLDVANPNSERIVLTQTQPFANHNGGDIHFGLDGHLYIAFGDGGSGNDPDCHAQDLGTWLGKILRIDVDALPYTVPPGNPFVGVAGARPEIWHLGLRNPWRFSIDRVTGDMYIGDVGQNDREEISFARANDAGVNFGWKVMEGTRCNSTSNCGTIPGCGDPRYERPIHEVFQSEPSGPRAIIGGYVYRGCALPGEYGRYFFSDHSDDLIRAFDFDPDTGIVTNIQNRTADFAPGGGLAIQNVASFGEDGFGELLIVDHSGSGSGEVYKMVPEGAVGATALVRNGSGTNSVCFSSASRPILGNVWRGAVDVRAHPGATATFLVSHTAPSSGTFVGAGELLVDSGSAFLFTAIRSSSGAIDFFDLHVPCDAALVGLRACTQAGVLGGGTELCNAVDLTLGHF